MPLVFHVFIAAAVTVYFVDIMVCGRQGIGPLKQPVQNYTSDFV